MSKPLPSMDRRYVGGRRVMLVSAAVFALSRALYYLPSTSNMEVTPTIQLLTQFTTIWFWVALWGITFGLCVRDLFRPTGSLGISALVGLLMAWGATYLLSYIGTVATHGWGSREWFTFATYAGLGGVIFGLLMKVGALKNRGDRG